MDSLVLARLFPIAVLMWLVASPSHAQDFACHSVERFHVNEIEQEVDIGTIFAVKVRGPNDVSACDVTVASADFVIGSDGDPLWFDALFDRHLVMTRSSGPHGDLVVFDLDRRDYVLDVPADDMTADESGVTYWERLEDGTRQTCPQFDEYAKDGLGASITAESRFDFASGTVSVSGKQRCDSTQ